MSSDSNSSEGSKKPQKPEVNGDSTSTFTAPPCNMCPVLKQSESVACCKTCERYLCNRCHFAHRIMISFNEHKVELLTGADNFHKFYKKWSDADGTDSTSNGSHRSKPADEAYDTHKTIQYLELVLAELDKVVLTLVHERNQTVGGFLDVSRIYREYLKSRENAVVAAMDTFYKSCREAILMRKLLIQRLIKEMLKKLEMLSYFDFEFDGDHDEACGIDLKRLFSDSSASLMNGCNAHHSASDSSIPTLLKQSDSDGVSSDTTSSLSVFTPISYPLTFSYDNGASPNYVVPKELLNLPVVASNPNESKSSCFLDLSTTSDPDKIPQTKSDVNSMQLVKMFGQKGTGSSQFNAPHGICLGLDEEIVVADSSNHRIQIFDKSGCFKRMFGIAGRHDGHLWHPRKVAFLPIQKRYVVCDRGYERSRMQIFSEDGKFYRKIDIHFIDIVAGITVSEKEEIVVVDSVTPTVFIIGPNDYLRSLDCSDFMEEPSDIAVHGGHFYICDFKGHKVVVVDDDGRLLRQFGTKDTTNYPNGISISLCGDVVLGDSHGNFYHVVVFSNSGNFIAEYRCFNVKVSRCCGLQLTSEGQIVTVDKNYHRVIVLDTLYLPTGF